MSIHSETTPTYDPRLSTRELRGTDLMSWINVLGALRIQVFREFPYLYDGNIDYERDYLQRYAQSPNSLVILLLNEQQVIGASTCQPLKDEDLAFQKPFLNSEYPLHEICYFGESILMPEYRGMGWGKEFFKRREAHAQRLGLKWMTFCAVDRATDHPLRPAHYRDLTDFWKKQGYQKQTHLQAEFHWKEVHEEEETPKQLTFWIKSCPN